MGLLNTLKLSGQGALLGSAAGYLADAFDEKSTDEERRKRIRLMALGGAGTGLGIASISPKFAAAYILAEFARLPKFVPDLPGEDDDAKKAAQIRKNTEGTVLGTDGVPLTRAEKGRVVRKAETRKSSLQLDSLLPDDRRITGDEALKGAIRRQRDPKNREIFNAIGRTQSTDPEVRQAALTILGNSNPALLSQIDADLGDVDLIQSKARASTTPVLAGDTDAIRTAIETTGQELPPTIRKKTSKGLDARNRRAGTLRYENRPKLPPASGSNSAKRRSQLSEANVELKMRRSAAERAAAARDYTSSKAASDTQSGAESASRQFAEEMSRRKAKGTGKGKTKKTVEEMAEDILKRKAARAQADRETRRKSARKVAEKLYDAKQAIGRNKNKILAGAGLTSVLAGAGLGVSALRDRAARKKKEDEAYEEYLNGL